MAWTFKLTDGTTTVDLNDGTNTFINLDGFYAPPPRRNMSLTGANLFRHGADVIYRSYENRQVTVGIDLKGTDATALGTKIGDIWDILRKADEYSVGRVGTQVQLEYQWDGGVKPIYFNILEGVLDLGRSFHGPYLSQGTRARNAVVELLCEPFAVGTVETIENYLDNPSFEMNGVSLAAGTVADWSKTDGNGTTNRDTTKSKYGTASAKTVRTDGVDDNGIYVEFVGTEFTANDNIGLSVWAYFEKGVSGMEVRAHVEFKDSGGVLKSTAAATLDTTGTAFAQLKIEGTTVEPSAGTGTVRVNLLINGGDGTGTVFWDGALVVKAAAIPNAWVSGRDVRNHHDDNGQQHINYVDIYDVPGDVSAPMQVKALAVDDQDEFWAGARHAGKQKDANINLEGEDFAGGGWALHTTGDLSAGSGGRSAEFAAVGNPASPTTSTLTITTPSTGQFRVLARAETFSVGGTGAGGIFGIGIGYTYGTVTKDPSITAHYTNVVNNHGYYDLGVIAVPPISVPEDTTVGTLGLRLAYYLKGVSAGSYQLDVDNVVLMPVDGGGIYGKTSVWSATDKVYMMDSKSRFKGLWMVSTADVANQFATNQIGNPPESHPKGTRIYFVTRNVFVSSLDDALTVSVSYIPRFLHVGT